MIDTFSGLFRNKYGFILILGLLFAVLFALPAKAGIYDKDQPKVDPVHHRDQCLAVLYDNTNGLPTSEANDIVQTKDGVIWIGCYGGLVRYDGQTFERLDSTFGITSVVELLADSQQRLWIGTNDSGLAMIDNYQYYFWGEKEGLRSDKVNGIAEDPNGLIYVATTNGIAIVQPDYSLETVDDPRIADEYIELVASGCDGVIYGLTNESDCFGLKDGKVVLFIGHDEEMMQGITDIYPDQKVPGYFYLETNDSELYYGTLTGSREEWIAIDVSPLYNVMNVSQIGDQIWICARNGIGVLEEGNLFILQDIPLNNSVRHMMIDYEGNMWFTSSHQGVMKIVANRFTDLFARYDIEPDVVNSTCMCEDKLFVGTDNGLIVLDDSGEVAEMPLSEAKTASGEDLEEYDLIEMLDGIRCRSIIRDSQDRLWFSTWRSRGLVCYDHGSVTVYTEDDGLMSNYIRVVWETADGKYLVACSGGLNIIEGGQVTAGYGKEQGIANTESLCVCEGPNGDYLLGSNGGGIYVINDDGVRVLDREDGLTSNTVMRIKKDRTRDIYWIVTSNAIAYMTEDYKVTTIGNFPYSNNFDLYQSSKDEMWVLSSNGIYVVPTSTMFADIRINPVHYDLTTGMSSIPVSNSYSELTEEGDLYVSGNTSVAKVNIDASAEGRGELIMGIPYIVADEIIEYPDKNGNFKISSHTKKLVIYCYVYTSSLINPEVSYRLEGFDKVYTTVNRSELRPITYTNLRGGTYRFQLDLKSETGRVTESISVAIVKDKRLTEQLWFNILILVVLAAVVITVVQIYVRKKRRDMEKQHKEELNKERLTTELKTAATIQERMLPHEFPPFPDRKEFDIYATMTPAREVGGDFYDFFFVDEDHLCMAIADVSGKGVPASLMMMISKVILQNYAMLGKRPATILEMSNEMICANNPSGMFVTVWLGVLEVSTGIVYAANAGHEYPALMEKGTFSLMKDPHGLVLGGMEGTQYKEYQFVLEPGDKLFVYTDGVPEATAAGDRMFGTDRLIEALNQDPNAEPEQILKNVRSAVDAFVKDEEQFDDMTMLCLEYHGPAIDPKLM